MGIQQILMAQGGGGPSGPTPDGYYLFNGSSYNWQFAGPGQNKPGYNSSTPTPGSNIQTWSFDTNSYMSSQNHNLNLFTISMWFYPTAYGTQVLVVQNTQIAQQSYHASLFEINSSGTVSARFYNNSGLTTTERVSLNNWNHVYISYTGTQSVLQLNGGAQVVSTESWVYPQPFVLLVGSYSATNLGNNSQYQGYIGEIKMYDYTPANDYNDTKINYLSRPAFYVDANNLNSTVPATVVANFPSYGYAGSTNLFSPSDFLVGSGTTVQPGWTVSNSLGWSGTVTAVTPNWNGVPNSIGITVDIGYWGSAPYNFRDPAVNPDGTVWYDISGNGRNVTLYNTPSFNLTGTRYYSFDPASLEWGEASTLGDLNSWTVETWIYLNASLNTTAATCPVTTVFDDPGGQGTTGKINYTISNNNVAPGYPGLKAGFFDGNGWQETAPSFLNVGQWYHVVGTYDRGQLKTYVNGSRENTLSYVGMATANSGKLRIGRRWDEALTATNLWPGRIGLVRIYPNALPDTEVTANFNATKSTYGL